MEGRGRSILEIQRVFSLNIINMRALFFAFIVAFFSVANAAQIFHVDHETRTDYMGISKLINQVRLPSILYVILHYSL